MLIIRANFSGRNNRIRGEQREAHLHQAIIKVELQVRNSLLQNNTIQRQQLESHISPDNQTLVLFSSPLIRLFSLKKDHWHRPNINRQGCFQPMYRKTHKACSLRSNLNFILVTIQIFLHCLLQQEISTVVFVGLSNPVQTSVSKNQWPLIG